MNIVAWRYAIAALAVVFVGIVLGLALNRERLERLKETIGWLLKTAYLDFVQMVIFLKPWKAYVWPTAVVLWIILAYVVASYMITTSPDITEIPAVFIPVIGYLYFVSVLIILKSVLGLFKKQD
jgi:hypothetical protein